MAWEWSHTNEAYEYARERVFELEPQVLHVICAEWVTDFRQPNWEVFYNKKLNYFSAWDTDSLREYVWRRAKEQRTCDNGGFNAWVCPAGCHTVPFGPKEEE